MKLSFTAKASSCARIFLKLYCSRGGVKTFHSFTLSLCLFRLHQQQRVQSAKANTAIRVSLFFYNVVPLAAATIQDTGLVRSRFY